MKKVNFYIPWAFLYGCCAALGFIPEPVGILRGICIMMSLLFFVPPALILARAIPRERQKDIRLVRNLSLISLIATMTVLILNFLSARAPRLLGDILHGLLILVSAPMVCSQFWVISLFCWACLLMVCLQYGGNKASKRK